MAKAMAGERVRNNTQDEESPEHGALHEPIERPKQPWMHASEEMSRRSQKGNDGEVTQEISNGAQRVFLPAFLGDSRTDLGQGESRRLEEGRSHLLLVCATIAASIFFFTMRHSHRQRERERGISDGEGKGGIDFLSRGVRP